MKISVQFDIPDSALASLTDKGSWSGRVSAKLTSTSGREKQISKKQTSLYHKEKNKASQYAHDMIAFWNTLVKGSDFDRRHEKRNQPLSKSDAAKVDRELKSLQKEKWSSDQVCNLMEKYFEQVRKGKHWWGTPETNHAYKDLTGFLSALKRQGTQCWWNKQSKPPIQDENPENTRCVADAYAKKFLGTKSYPNLTNPSKAYKALYLASKRLGKASGSKTLPFGFEALTGRAMAFLGDSVSKPSESTLNQDWFWVNFTQYLRDQLPGCKVKPEDFGVGE